VVKERPPELRRYPDWEAACRHSRTGRAVAEIWIEHKGEWIRAEVVKPRFGDGTIHYYHSGLVIRKATSREIDCITTWKVY